MIVDVTSVAFLHAAMAMAVAVFCGALIGLERQVRQRMAGIRTNALVALGAAGFVVFSQLFPNEVSPTRVAAQVVSGIGFLGGGIIFRHGFSIHGINTAATLWCSAAIGLMAGAGRPAFALLATGMVIFVNLGMRPLVQWLKRRTRAGIPQMLEARVSVSCPTVSSGAVRTLVLGCLSQPGYRISAFNRADGDDATLFTLMVGIEDGDDSMLTKALSPVMIDPHVTAVSWELAGES